MLHFYIANFIVEFHSSICCKIIHLLKIMIIILTPIFFSRKLSTNRKCNSIDLILIYSSHAQTNHSFISEIPFVLAASL